MLSFALLYGLISLTMVAGYRHSYPTPRERAMFAQSFGANKAVRLFYGAPHDLLTIGGYTEWRLVGVGSIFAAVWGVLAAVRAMRAEEDAGRQELVLAGTVGRRSAYVAALGAIAVGATILWLATFLGLVVARLPAGSAASLSLATISPVLVFTGVGAVASQVAATRRLALELASGVIVLSFLLRVVADTSSGVGWLRWTTPLGWAEELRPFTGTRPAALVPPVIAGALLLLLAGSIAVRRDIGDGLLHGKDSATPRLRLLGSPTALALRNERGSLLAWLAGAGMYALVIGLLATTFSTRDISANLQEQLRKLGGISITTPTGALGLYFLFFVLAVSLFACAQVSAIRREEADGQLETLLVLPVGRSRWLIGRLVLAASGAAAIALTAATLAWAGAASQHADVSLTRMLAAGGNCLPTALLFLGLAALAFAVVPRASAGIAYALVLGSFLWQLLGALLDAPHWLVDLTPFQHVALVPAQPFRPAAAAALLAIGAATATAAVVVFRRRDLEGA